MKAEAVRSAVFIKAFTLPANGETMMDKPKDQAIEQIRQDAIRKIGEFSKELVNPGTVDKEEIRAGMEFYKNLATMCDLCLDIDELL